MLFGVEGFNLLLAPSVGATEPCVNMKASKFVTDTLRRGAFVLGCYWNLSTETDGGVFAEVYARHIAHTSCRIV